jgi:hypothetical protein
MSKTKIHESIMTKIEALDFDQLRADTYTAVTKLARRKRFARRVIAAA